MYWTWKTVSSLHGLVTSFSHYFSPKSPPNSPPPFPPFSPLNASSSIHSRRKSLSFISSTLVSLVCSCASCLLKASRVGILVIYTLINVFVPDHEPLGKFSSKSAPDIYFWVSTYKDCAIRLKRWIQDRTALPRLPASENQILSPHSPHLLLPPPLLLPRSIAV